MALLGKKDEANYNYQILPVDQNLEKKDIVSELKWILKVAVFGVAFILCLQFLYPYILVLSSRTFLYLRDETSKKPPKVILVSYDGFRWDYMQRNRNTPTFQSLIKDGVTVSKGLKNTFATKTAPNHYSLATGLYEESHGIVGNFFYDPKLKKEFNYFTTRWATDPRFFLGEPIWYTNDVRGRSANHRSGCVMWVGCDVPTKGHLPLHYVSYDANFSWNARVDALISWFKDDKDPINFGLLYIEEPDITGHHHGPNSPEIDRMVTKLDTLTGYLVDKLKSANIFDEVNLIFTSDHGMASTPLSQTISLDDYVSRSTYQSWGGSPNKNVLPKKGFEDAMYQKLHKKVNHLNVYKKIDIPKDYHYTNSDRIMPLQLFADLHWKLLFNNESIVHHKNGSKIVRMNIGNKHETLHLGPNHLVLGDHGYNNSLAEMHPYFIAHGPAFKSGYEVETLWNVDVYPLICHIIGIPPAPNNGSLMRAKQILRVEDGPVTQMFGEGSNYYSEDGQRVDLLMMLCIAVYGLCLYVGLYGRKEIL